MTWHCFVLETSWFVFFRISLHLLCRFNLDLKARCHTRPVQLFSHHVTVKTCLQLLFHGVLAVEVCLFENILVSSVVPQLLMPALFSLEWIFSYLNSLLQPEVNVKWNLIFFLVSPPLENEFRVLKRIPFKIKPALCIHYSERAKCASLCCSRLRTSCTTWCRTWMRGRRTWRRGSLCWRRSWRRYWATCRPCRGSSARSSASSTGTSWRCSSSLMTNTAPSARSLRPGGGHPPRPRPPPPRAARNASAQDFCHHMAKLHLL